MKRTLSILLSIILILSSVFCVDFSAFAKTSALYNNSNTLQQHVAGIDNEKSLARYPEFINYRATGEFFIPGLQTTVSYCKDKKQYLVCDSMIPQAMCKMGDKTLITAYDGDGDCRSVVYVLDKSNRLIKTLILPDSFHVGGISYDVQNKMILVAKSGYKCLGCISAEDFATYLSSELPYVRIKYTISECTLSTKPTAASGVTYYNGKVYISTFDHGYNSCVICYAPSYDYERNTYHLSFCYRVTLPDYVQGVTIGDYMGKTKMFLSVSYGRNETKGVYESYLYTYDFDATAGKKVLDNVLACPPMLQQTYCLGNKLYCLFENGAKLYRSVNKDPLDLVVPIKLSGICSEPSGAVVNIDYENVNGGKEVIITSNVKNSKIYYSTNGICPYISKGFIYNGKAYKKYLKTLTSPIYAVAVYKGRIIASDYMYIEVKKTETPQRPYRKSKTSDSITLKWKKTPKVSGYYIYRSKSENGKYKLIATVGGSKTTYTDTKLKSETMYYYKMVAFKKGWADSDFSEIDAVKTKKKPSKKKDTSKADTDKKSTKNR